MKRLTSIFLVLAMLLTLAPMNIFAADTVNISSEQTENMTQEEYAQWKQNLVSQNRVSMMSIDSSSEEVEGDYSANIEGYIRNEFIEAYINSSGHYTMGTTGGNPDSASDNNKLLLYGHPGNSTTETLIKIDDEETYFYSNNTVFNSEQTQAITTATIDDVEVKQIITLETNTYTGNADVASIKYIMTNNSSQAKQIGGRIMLDTMLGNNDGAPFRIPGIGNVTSEIELSGNDIPEYWQAFDNLTTPNVISTGNFYRTAAEKPDKVQFADWRTISGSSWGYSVTAGHSFTHDSAVASYYNPRTVLPGQSRTIVTYYGISDFSSSDVEDDITLRVSAPSFLGGNNEGYLNNPFVVTAYIGNYTSSTVNNITARISLPEELQIEGSDPTTKNVGSISSGTETFIKWTIRALPQETGKTVIYNITINGEGIGEKTIPVSLNLYTTNDLYRNISFNLNGGDGVAPETQRVLVGTKGTEPEKPTRTGYVFKGWYANPQCTGISWFNFLNTGALLRTTENITLYAKWQQSKVTLNDLYGFSNSANNFNSTYSMSNEYFNILTEGMSDNQKEAWRTSKVNSNWEGSCYGMGVTEALMAAEILSPDFYEPTKQTVRQLNNPRNNSRVEGLINFYQLSQSLAKAKSQSYGRYRKRTALENLVQKAKDITSPDDYICMCIGHGTGGHALLVYGIEETTDGRYRIKIFESNENDDLNASYMIVESDYSNATFYCDWNNDWNEIQTSDNSLVIQYLLSQEEYNVINLQQKLLNRGYSVAPFSLLRSASGYDKITTTYNSLVIESSEGGTVTIENDDYTGDFTPNGVSLNESGVGLDVFFDENSYYKISTIEMKENYLTKILLGDTDFISIETDKKSEIVVHKSDKVTVTSVEPAIIKISLNQAGMPCGTFYIETQSSAVEIEKSGDRYIVSSINSLLDSTIGMTSEDSFNDVVLNVDTTDLIIDFITSADGVQMTVSDGLNICATLDMLYNVSFYTYGGSAVDDIANITKGTTISKPVDPVFEGFTFGGWYKSPECLDGEEWDFESDIIERDTILHAKWLADENYMHSVTFKSEGNDDIVIIVKHGDELTEIPAVPAKLGHIGQWDVTDFSSITSNVIVNALYSPATEKAVKPVASPAGGNYSSSQTVTLSTTTDGAEIYYTLNGSAPSSNSQKYLQPITISSTTTLKAVAVKGGMLDSDVMTETYNISNGGSTTGGGGGGGTPSYKITVIQGENGTISPSSASVTQNGNKTFTIVANEGYEIEDVIVDGESVGAVTSYTFEKVTKAATITAKFKKIEETKVVWENPFNDVKENDWFYEAVKFASENGITSGVSENKFAPNDKVTRGQFITMLCRAYGIEEMTGDNFADCGNTWYTGYLAAAKQLGISNGVGDNKFAPEKEITREEMVTLIYNYLKSIDKVDIENEETSFKDNDSISDWAKAGVAFASGKGYVNGKGNNLFDPNGDATRAELAQIFFNMFK